jgi:hypothetical protein
LLLVVGVLLRSLDLFLLGYVLAAVGLVLLLLRPRPSQRP